MANRRKIWVYSPRKPPKPGVPEAIKQALDAKARLYPLGLGVRPAVYGGLNWALPQVVGSQVRHS